MGAPCRQVLRDVVSRHLHHIRGWRSLIHDEFVDGAEEGTERDVLCESRSVVMISMICGQIAMTVEILEMPRGSGILVL